MPIPSKGTALITGACRGIGAVYADRLAKRGYDLIVVARSASRLEALAARLTSETGRSVTALPVDLNSRADLAKVETTLRDDQTITLLVNNAGIASVAPLLHADVEKMADNDRSQRDRAHVINLRRRARIRRAWRRHDHQHRPVVGIFARIAQRRVRRDQSLRPCA